MQSIEIRRFPTYRLAVAILAIGTLVIALTGTGVLFDDSDNSSGQAQAVDANRTTQRTAPLYSDTFLEWNLNLPPVSDQPVQRSEGTEPLELNVTPPGTTRPSVRSYAETLFVEMNTMLPGTAAPTVMSYDEMRFIEMNMLPGDDSPYLPGAGGSQSGGGLTAY